MRLNTSLRLISPIQTNKYLWLAKKKQHVIHLMIWSWLAGSEQTSMACTSGFVRASSSVNCLVPSTVSVLLQQWYEPRHDKTNKVTVCPAKTQISLGICPVWSESSLSAWRKLGSLATHWVHSEDSDQTGQMPRLIWVFAERTLTLLVLSCHGSY